jgi:hypothetical protein
VPENEPALPVRSVVCAHNDLLRAHMARVNSKTYLLAAFVDPPASIYRPLCVLHPVLEYTRVAQPGGRQSTSQLTYGEGIVLVRIFVSILVAIALALRKPYNLLCVLFYLCTSNRCCSTA